MQDVLEAYLAFRCGKRGTASVQAFEADWQVNLVELYEDLLEGVYRPGRSICFAITRPKPREVWAAEPRDRVVHHLLYRRIGHAIERTFIADTFACIPGRGTLYAAKRIQAKVRAITQGGARRAFYLKCDIRNFFVSIDKRILADELERRIPEPFWLDLALRILFHDPREDVQMQGRPQDLARVPPYKSLLNQPPHLGLPIGNLSSQFYANVLLDVLDRFVKHQLRARHYGRYVDDIVLLHESAQQLNAWLGEISAFLPERLGLELNPVKTILQPVERGLDFCGQVITSERRTLRRRTFNDALQRLGRMPEEDVYQAANSYFGLCRQTSHGHRDRARIAKLLLRRGFCVDANLTKTFAGAHGGWSERVGKR